MGAAWFKRPDILSQRSFGPCLKFSAEILSMSLLWLILRRFTAHFISSLVNGCMHLVVGMFSISHVLSALNTNKSP